MINPEHVIDFFSLMAKYNINYVLIKNDGGLIPYNIEDEKDIDILVHPDEYNYFFELLTKNNYVRLNGESKKYYFAYKLRSDLYLQKDDLFIHAYDRLACTSLTNMGICKLPLDRHIQADIWKNKIWDKQNNWWIMDDTSILIYLLVRSIFDKNRFRNIYKDEIKKRKYLLHDTEFINKLNFVFFKFSPQLIAMLEKENYENIIPTFYSFTDY